MEPEYRAAAGGPSRSTCRRSVRFLKSGSVSRRARRLAPFTVVGHAGRGLPAGAGRVRYVQLFEATSEVSKLENQLSALQSQQTQLQSRYEARIDLDAIETAAGDLGLTKPSQEQIVYLDLSGADRAEIYQEEKTSVFSEIVSAMEQSVSGLIAYLRAASA